MGGNSHCHDTVTQIIQSAQGGYTPDVAQSRVWNTRHHAEDKAGHRNPFKTNLSPCEVFTSLTSTRSSIYSSIDGSIHWSPIYYWFLSLFFPDCVRESEDRCVWVRERVCVCVCVLFIFVCVVICVCVLADAFAQQTWDLCIKLKISNICEESTDVAPTVPQQNKCLTKTIIYDTSSLHEECHHPLSTTSNKIMKYFRRPLTSDHKTKQKKTYYWVR